MFFEVIKCFLCHGAIRLVAFKLREKPYPFFLQLRFLRFKPRQYLPLGGKLFQSLNEAFQQVG